ncbi:major capsid protein [Mycobacterium avium]|uniref:major capsid protein n=1 Tax=Mycobacterium avium TaxID=1764 RepID=UPI0004026A69|nr:major capsid protein [Mycobacterium avium]
MPNPLIPELNGRRLTVDAALKEPSRIRDQIATLADDQILLPKVFRPFGAQIQGGGLLYSVIAATDFFTSDIEKRTPGAEYRVIEGVSPTPKLAAVEDWGGKFQVEDERRTRNDISYIDQQTTQLANTIARKLDTRAVAALEAADIATVAVSNPWDSLTFVGPDANLTPGPDRPTSHFAQAQELADLEELGVVHDTLLAPQPGAGTARGIRRKPRRHAGIGWAQDALKSAYPGRHRVCLPGRHGRPSWIRGPADRRRHRRAQNPLHVGAGIRRARVRRRPALCGEANHRPRRLTPEGDNENGTHP